MVKSVNGDVVSATDPQTKKPVTITLKPYTTMKRLDDATAMTLARRLNPTFQQGGGRGRGQAGPQGGTAASGGGSPGTMAGMQGAGGAQSGGRGGFGGRGMRVDPTKLLDQQATITATDLKPNEPVIITGINGSDPSQITAITLIAGVDPILRAAPNRGPDPLGGSWNFGDIGGGMQ
jgi:hypothetical protein